MEHRRLLGRRGMRRSHHESQAMKFDLSDAVMVLGVLMMLGGVALVHVPSAIALTGIVLVVIVLMAPARKTR
jgi:uncharacterized membrane protein